jgi:hypothetical protein
MQRRAHPPMPSRWVALHLSLALLASAGAFSHTRVPGGFALRRAVSVRAATGPSSPEPPPEVSPNTKLDQLLRQRRSEPQDAAPGGESKLDQLLKNRRGGTTPSATANATQEAASGTGSAIPASVPPPSSAAKEMAAQDAVNEETRSVDVRYDDERIAKERAADEKTAEEQRREAAREAAREKLRRAQELDAAAAKRRSEEKAAAEALKIKLAAEEAARKEAEAAEAARKKAEEEAARIRAEKEAARKRAELTAAGTAAIQAAYLSLEAGDLEDAEGERAKAALAFSQAGVMAEGLGTLDDAISAAKKAAEEEAARVAKLAQGRAALEAARAQLANDLEADLEIAWQQR